MCSWPLGVIYGFLLDLPSGCSSSLVSCYSDVYGFGFSKSSFSGLRLYGWLISCFDDSGATLINFYSSVIFIWFELLSTLSESVLEPATFSSSIWWVCEGVSSCSSILDWISVFSSIITGASYFYSTIPGVSINFSATWGSTNCYFPIAIVC